MMTTEDLQTANDLIEDHKRLAHAKLALAGVVRGLFAGWAGPSDAELEAAIEAFRQRRLIAIDEQLRKLGVAPPEAKEDSALSRLWKTAEDEDR